MITHLEPDILECEVKEKKKNWKALQKKHLGSITTNKASGGDGIPVELFQILKDDAVKACTLYASKFGKLISGHHWKRSVFIPSPKKGNVKECSNYHTIKFISHPSKVMLKILQARRLSAIHEP